MSSTVETFDPYHEWLDIEPHEQPADHYRLLGLARFETDFAKIAARADERMARVRSFQVGPRGRFTQKLLNELSTAKMCLLSPAAKATYDAELARAMTAAMKPARAIPPAPPPAIPPPPPVRRTEPKLDELDAEPQPGTPWWRIVFAITAVTLVVLVAALAWGVAQQRWQPRPEPAASIPAPEPVAPEAEPEPIAGQPTVQLQEGSGEVRLAAATAQLAGGVELRHVGTSEVLGNWMAPDAAVHWRLRLIQPGFFQVELKYATAAEALGSEVVIAAGEQRKASELRASGGLEKFVTDTMTIAIPTSGEHAIELALRQELAGDWLVVESVRLIPVGGARPPAILPEE